MSSDFVRGYALKDILEEKEYLDIAEMCESLATVLDMAEASHAKFIHLFSPPREQDRGEAAAGIDVYYFQARIRDLLGLEDVSEMTYELEQDRNEEEEDDDDNVNRDAYDGEWGDELGISNWRG